MRVIGTALALLLWATSIAHAHGEGAAVVAVLGVEADGQPWLLQLTEGFAQRRAGAWHFLCPAALGLDEQALIALAAGGRGAWLIGADGPHWLDRAGTLEARGNGGLDTGHVLQLAALDGTVYALAIADASQTGTVLFALDDLEEPREVFRSSQTFYGVVAHGGGLWLLGAGSLAEGLAITAIDRAGGEAVTELGGWTRGGAAVRLRAAGDQLFVSGIAGNERFLYRVEDGGLVELVTSADALLGPVAADGRLWIAQGNDLFVLEDDRPVPVEQDLAVTCLTGQDDWAFVCALGDLYPLPAAIEQVTEQVGAGRVSLDGLLPPSTSDASCERQWLRFEADVMRAGYTPGSSMRDGGTVDGPAPDAGGRDAQADTDAGPDGSPDAGVPDAGDGGGGGCAVGGGCDPGAARFRLTWAVLVPVAIFVGRRRARP